MTSPDPITVLIKKYRWPVILLFTGLLAVAIPGLFRLNVTVEMDDYFLEDDPVLQAGREFNSVFDSGDFIGVLLESEDVFSRDSLELIHRIGEILVEKVPDTTGIISIASLDGKLTAGLYTEFNDGVLINPAAEIENLRQAISDSPLLGGTLVSGDFTEAWILVSLESDAGGGDEIAVGESAWKALENLPTGDDRITLSGVAVVAYRKYVELMTDLLRVLVIAAVLAVVLSLIILRSLKGVLGTLAVFSGSVIFVLGIQGWAGATLDSGFLGVPILLTMGISIGYSVHVHRFYRICTLEGDLPLIAASRAILKTGRPIFYTAATTIASLLSFLFVDIRPIRWVGYTSAASVLAAFVLSVVLFPVVLSFGRPEKVRSVRLGAGCPDRLFRWISQISSGRRKTVILSFLVAAGLSVHGLSLLEVDFDAIQMMGTRLPHMQDQVRVGESEIAVGEFMNLMLTMPEGYFLEAEGIRQVEALETRLSEHPGVKRVTSVTGVVAEVNSLMHRRDPAYAELPENDISLGALIRFLNSVLPEERSHWVDDGGSHARIYIETADFSSKKIETIITASLAEVADIFPSEVTATVSGSTYQVAMMNQYITRGLLTSVAAALTVISIIMIVVFRSFLWGLVAMIPNIFPVAIAGSVLGFAGIPLEFVTMTVAPIILGLAVDDTIHFMGALRDGLSKGQSFQDVLEETLLSVGAAISQTTFILCSAFLVFATSRVNSLRYMGIIAATGMIAAYLADLLLVPVLTGMLASRKERKGQ